MRGSWSEDKFFMLLLFRKLHSFGKKENTRVKNNWTDSLISLYAAIALLKDNKKCDNIRHLSERFVQQELISALEKIFLKLRHK